MKNQTLFRAALAATLAAGLWLTAPLQAQDPVATVETGCAEEIEKFCSQVMLGEGRLLACFYAHEDKLSGRCQYALYTAANQLDQAVSALDYVASQCSDDITRICPQVEMGEGRIIDCLRDSAETSDSCRAALDDVFE